MEHAARLDDHPVAVPVRPADRRAGHRDERRGRAAAAVHRIAGAQRRGAGGVRGRLHRAVLAHHVDVGRPDGRVRRRSPGRTSAPGNPERAMQGVAVASRIGLGVAAVVGALFLLIPAVPARGLRHDGSAVVLTIGQQLLRYLSVSGFFITVALSYTGGLQGTGDTRSPLYISHRLADRRAARHLLVAAGDARPRSRATSGWRSCSAT